MRKERKEKKRKEKNASADSRDRENHVYCQAEVFLSCIWPYFDVGMDTRIMNWPRYHWGLIVR